jgi:hypothetical protein
MKDEQLHQQQLHVLILQQILNRHHSILHHRHLKRDKRLQYN